MDSKLTNRFSVNGLMACRQSAALMRLLPRVADAMDSGNEENLNNVAVALIARMGYGNKQAHKPFILVIDQMRRLGYFESALDVTEAAAAFAPDFREKSGELFEEIADTYAKARPKAATGKLLEISNNNATHADICYRAIKKVMSTASSMYDFAPDDSYRLMISCARLLQYEPENAASNAEYKDAVALKLHEYSERIFPASPALAIEGLAAAMDVMCEGKKLDSQVSKPVHVDLKSQITRRFRNTVAEFYRQNPGGAHALISHIAKQSPKNSESEKQACIALIDFAYQLMHMDASKYVHVPNAQPDAGKPGTDKRDVSSMVEPLAVALNGLCCAMATAQQRTDEGADSSIYREAQEGYRHILLDKLYPMDPGKAYHFARRWSDQVRGIEPLEQAFSAVFGTVAQNYATDHPDKARRLLWETLAETPLHWGTGYAAASWLQTACDPERPIGRSGIHTDEMKSYGHDVATAWIATSLSSREEWRRLRKLAEERQANGKGARSKRPLGVMRLGAFLKAYTR